MKSEVSINLNGLNIVIHCSNEKDVFRLEKLFNRMIAFNSNTIINMRIDIYYDSLYEHYEYFDNELKCNNSIYLSPGINKYSLHEKPIYFVNKDSYMYEENGCYYVISQNKYSLYNLILEIMKKVYESNDYFIFHGNGIVVDDLAMSIIAQKQSGKTSLTSKLMQVDCPNKKFLSNDRILIGNEYTSYFPIEMFLNYPTIINDKFLRRYYSQGGTTSIPNRILANPREFVDCYDGVEYVSSSHNDLIIIPTIQLEDKRKLNVIQLTPDRKYEILRDCCFSDIDPEIRRDEWIISNRPTDEEMNKRIKALIDNLISRYNIIGLEYGCDLGGEEIYERIRKKV